MNYFDYFIRLYTKILNGSPNSYRYQRNWAKRFINSKSDDYSNTWGVVDSFNPGLGDYKKISNDIVEFSRLFKEGECLDVGCLDGKWATVLARYFTKVNLVDLTDLLVPLLTSKLGAKMGKFYKTKGNELNGFNDRSIDFIFSLDTLVRTPKKDIFNYFLEFYRVLKESGICYIHLPVIEKPRCVSKSFTSLTLAEIQENLTKCGFVSLEFDMNTLNHGVIIRAIKK